MSWYCVDAAGCDATSVVHVAPPSVDTCISPVKAYPLALAVVHDRSSCPPGTTVIVKLDGADGISPAVATSLVPVGLTPNALVATAL